MMDERSTELTAIMSEKVPSSVRERFALQLERHGALASQLLSLEERLLSKYYYEFTTACRDFCKLLDSSLDLRTLNSFPLCHSRVTATEPWRFEGARFFRLIVAPVRAKLNPLLYAELLSLVSMPLPTTDAVAFIEAHESFGSEEFEARLMLVTCKASHLALLGDHKGATKLVEAAEDEIEEKLGASLKLHSGLCRAKAAAAKAAGNLQNFYRSGILFLAYISLESITPEDGNVIIFDLIHALLTADGEYSFGELLYHPATTFVANDPGKAWILQFVTAFNEGRAPLFDAACALPGVSFTDAEWKLLRRKYTLMCLMELAFTELQRSRDSSKAISFAKVATHCNIDANQVEPVLMKALCNGLLTGRIDGVGEEVVVHSVKARILDKPRLEVVAQRFEEWSGKARLFLRGLEGLTVELVP
eukprot:Polyplicarium_translucidae@DN1861_c0_g1_i2.p1